MKKKAGTADLDEMPAEYNLDHSRARPNRFASRLPQGHVIGIVLEEDVSKRGKGARPPVVGNNS